MNKSNWKKIKFFKDKFYFKFKITIQSTLIFSRWWGNTRRIYRFFKMSSENRPKFKIFVLISFVAPFYSEEKVSLEKYSRSIRYIFRWLIIIRWFF